MLWGSPAPPVEPPPRRVMSGSHQQSHKPSNDDAADASCDGCRRGQLFLCVPARGRLPRRWTANSYRQADTCRPPVSGSFLEPLNCCLHERTTRIRSRYMRSRSARRRTALLPSGLVRRTPGQRVRSNFAVLPAADTPSTSPPSHPGPLRPQATTQAGRQSSFVITHHPPALVRSIIIPLPGSGPFTSRWAPPAG